MIEYISYGVFTLSIVIMFVAYFLLKNKLKLNKDDVGFSFTFLGYFYIVVFLVNMVFQPWWLLPWMLFASSGLILAFFFTEIFWLRKKKFFKELNAYFDKLVMACSQSIKRPGKTIFILFLDFLFVALTLVALRIFSIIILSSSSKLDSLMSTAGPDGEVLKYLITNISWVVLLCIILLSIYVSVKTITWSFLRFGRWEKIFIKRYPIYQIFFILLGVILTAFVAIAFRESIAGFLLVLILFFLVIINILMPAFFQAGTGIFKNFIRIFSQIGKQHLFIVGWIMLLFVVTSWLFSYLDSFLWSGMSIIKVIILLIEYQLLRRYLVLVR